MAPARSVDAMGIRNTQEWIDGLRPRVKEYTPAELAEALAARPGDLVVVDIREIQERVDSGAIPGSHHAPRGMLEFWADPAMGYYREFFDPDKEIILHCAGGQRSVLAALALEEMGYPRVAHLDVGFDGWKRDGQPIEDQTQTSKWIRRPKTA